MNRKDLLDPRFLLALAITVGVLLFDAVTPLGVVAWLGYLIPIYLITRTPLKHYVRSFSDVCCLLLVIGFFLSPPGISPIYAVLNRALGTLLFLGVGVLLDRRTKAEDLLRESREEYMTIFDLAAAGKAVADANTGKFLRANQKYCEMTGYSEEELRGLTYWDITHPDDLDRNRKKNAELQEGKTQEFGMEKRYIRKDGSTLWVYLTVAALRDARGRPTRLVGSVVDISSRVQAEEALRASETRYRRIFEAAHDGVLLLDAQTGSITDANPFMTELLGYSRGEILGKELWEIGLLKDEQSSRQVFRELQERGSVRYDDHPLQSKSGELREVEFVSNVYEENGSPIIQCNIRDITQRRKNEEEREHLFHQVEQEHEKLRTVVESIADEIWVLDARDNHLSTNPAVARGLGLEQDIGQTLDQVLSRLDIRNPDGSARAPQDCPLRRAMQGEIVSGEEMIRHLKTHEWRYRHFHASPMRDSDGRVFGAVSVVTDVTSLCEQEERLRKTAEELARSNKDLQHYAYVASHDLQEPLRSITGYLQLLSKRYRGRLDPDADDFIDFAVSGAKRMSDLILGLLDYSRIGRQARTPQPVNAVIALDHAIEGLRDAIAQNDASVTYDEGLPTVMADEGQLARVFHNLISNAIKFRREERPIIHIGAVKRGGDALFSVSDNGIGIDPAYQERVFRIFERLHPPGKYPGAGIGLAVCRRIVEHLGGQICLDSVPGKGSAFFFTLRSAEGADLASTDRVTVGAARQLAQETAATSNWNI